MRECVGYSYHYCAEWDCEACVCVRCDGGRSVAAALESEDLLSWDQLVEGGTTHFKTVECCWMAMDKCPSPKMYMILCKDEVACSGGDRKPNFCTACGKWQCDDCNDCKWCYKCGMRNCPEGCAQVEQCDSYWRSICNTCGPARLCEDGCADVRDSGRRNHAIRHCPTCYLDHPATAARVEKRYTK